MENSFYYDTDAINFIKVLFRIFICFVIISTVLIFTLELNDTVKFKEGQIYSDTPQLKIISPNEAKVLRTMVREGQKVNKGDTLFVLENKKTKSDFDVTTMSIKMLNNKIEVINKLISSSRERKKSLQQLLDIQSKIYMTDRKKTEQEIATLNNKINLSTQQAGILKDQFKTDSLLYSKGAISKLELSQTKSRNIDERQGQIDINSNYRTKNYDFENLSNNFEKTSNDLKRNIIEIENQIQNYERDLIEIESSIEDKKSNLVYMGDELSKLSVISPIEGTISNLFNVRQNLQIINKGDLMTIIAPTKDKFYAKIILDEKNLAYIKTGQEINLKLDAYNYYRFGAIKGRITYVSSSDVDKTFYCIAKMQKYNRNIHLKAGYTMRGEIIIERMRLFQYIIKKLFNKIDNSVN